MSRRHRTRIVRAVAAAVVAGAALTGCSVAVTGTPHAAPAPVAPRTTTPAPIPAPTTPSLPSISGLGEEADVVADWMADGWIPRPILPVTDPASGVTAWMFGTSERRDAAGGGTLYRAVGAPASIVSNLAVFPVPTGYEADADIAATNTATANNGRVVDSRPTSVGGYPALDVRIEFTDPQGRTIVDLIRYVETPEFLVGVESLGYSTDEDVLQQVQRIVADKVTFASV
jgi:hypothetical protein